MSEYIPSPKEIKAYLDQYIVGQEQAKRDISILGYNHFMRWYRTQITPTNESLATPPKLSGLITGPSGSGKTFMCTKLAEYLDIPILTIDATALSVPGYKGVSIYDMFTKYIEEYRGTPKFDYISRGILYIDEIDKLGGTLETSNAGNWMERLQQSLLTIMDGTKIKIKTSSWSEFDINTETMLIITSGSFAAINRARAKDSSYGIGFTTNHADKDVALHSPVTRDELEKHGMISEFIGRLNIISYTNKLSIDELKDIVHNCCDSFTDQFESLFLMSGTSLGLTDEDIDNIVYKAYDSPYGARYLKSMLFDYIHHRLFDLEPCSQFITQHSFVNMEIEDPLEDDLYNIPVGYSGDSK